MNKDDDKLKVRASRVLAANRQLSQGGRQNELVFVGYYDTHGKRVRSQPLRSAAEVAQFWGAQPESDSVEDGGYVLPALNLIDGDRLWARNVGQAVFHFWVGINSLFTELHWIRFDIDDPANAFQVGPPGNSYTAAVAGCGDGRSAHIEDCFFEGNVAIDAAISAIRTDRVQIRDVGVTGIGVGTTTTAVAAACRLTSTE